MQLNPESEKEVLILKKERLKILEELKYIEFLKTLNRPTERDLDVIDQEIVLELSLGYLNGNISIIENYE